MRQKWAESGENGSEDGGKMGSKWGNWAKLRKNTTKLRKKGKNEEKRWVKITK